MFAASAALPSALQAAEKGTILRFLSPDGAVTLTVEGQNPVTIRRGRHVTFRVDAPKVRYMVSDGNDWQYTAEVGLKRVRRRTITLVIPGAHVQVINRTDEDREVLADGRRIGVLKRGKTATYGPISAGTTLLKTIGVRSRNHVAARFRSRPGGLRTVVLPAIPAGLFVVNPISNTVRVLIDHRDYGTLTGKAQLFVLGLAPGNHAVKLVDTASGRPFRFDARLAARGASAPESGAIHLTVINDTGEKLMAPAALGGYIDHPLAPDERLSVTLPKKAFRIRLTGAESGLDYHRDVDPTLRTPDLWRIERPRGQLHLTNGTGERARVHIDRHGAIELEADAKVSIRRVPAGRLRLHVMALESKQQFKRGIQLAPNGHVSWTVTSGRSELMIVNKWAEPVELAIDGSPRGRVSPGATFRVTRILPGPHDVVALTTVSKVREVIAVLVVDGKVTRLPLRPPHASLRLDNQLDKSLVVLVRGVEVGRAAPGKVASFPVRSGRMAVEVRVVGSTVSTTWFGVVAPSQQIELPNPTTGSAPVVVENTTNAPVEIRVDARAPVTIAPGAKHVAAGLTAGIHLVQVKGRGFMQRQRVRVTKGEPPVHIRLMTDIIAATKRR